MQLITKPLKKEEILALIKTFGDYAKITADISQNVLVIGCELHADGEQIIIEKYHSHQDKIWGGGIRFSTKTLDTTAVLNIRPRLHNESVEILDPSIRAQFISVIKHLLKELWN